jgi:uncharacterized repeat protein (TIGR03803 family)
MKEYRSLGRLGATFLFITLLSLLLAPVAVAQNQFKTLKRFTQRGAGRMNGYAPSDSLIVDQAGNLYGTTVYGGSNNCSRTGCGVVFELTPNASGGWTEKVLYRFAGGNDGANPYAGLIFDAAGNLYGTTSSGGANGPGTVFQLVPNADGSWSESVLYSFCSFTNCTDGGLPAAGVIMDRAGNFYGTTVFGGNSANNCNGGNLNCGVVYKLTPKSGGGWTESVIYNFTGGSDGGQPYAGLIFDQSGNLYGTTEEGGGVACRFGCGVVFQLTPQSNGSWTESVLHSFTGGSDGGAPAGLIFDAKGNLYGATGFGGHIGRNCSVGCGLAFELTPNGGSWTETVLHQFRVRDGGFPAAGLTFDAAGNLYGTTEADGPGTDDGVVFKLTPNSSGGWRETVVHTFQNRAGSSPRASVVFDGAGNLYGTTYGDGTATFGSVFEITP